MTDQKYLDPIRMEWVSESDAIHFATTDRRDNLQAFSRWDATIQRQVHECLETVLPKD